MITELADGTVPQIRLPVTIKDEQTRSQPAPPQLPFVLDHWVAAAKPISVLSLTMITELADGTYHKSGFPSPLRSTNPK